MRGANAAAVDASNATRIVILRTLSKTNEECSPQNTRTARSASTSLVIIRGRVKLREQKNTGNRSRGRPQLEVRGARNAAAAAEEDEDVAAPLHRTGHGDLEAVAVALDPGAPVAGPAPGQRI